MLEASVGLALFGPDMRFRWVNAALTRLGGQAGTDPTTPSDSSGPANPDPSGWAGLLPSQAWPEPIATRAEERAAPGPGQGRAAGGGGLPRAYRARSPAPAPQPPGAAGRSRRRPPGPAAAPGRSHTGADGLAAGSGRDVSARDVSAVSDLPVGDVSAGDAQAVAAPSGRRPVRRGGGAGSPLAAPPGSRCTTRPGKVFGVGLIMLNMAEPVGRGRGGGRGRDQAQRGALPLAGPGRRPAGLGGGAGRRDEGRLAGVALDHRAVGQRTSPGSAG